MWGIEEFDRRRGLNHLALAHDDDAVSHLGNDTHVMGNQDDGRSELLLQVPQKIENLTLHGHVQRRGRFVRDEDGGAQRNRHGDHYALAHAA